MNKIPTDILLEIFEWLPIDDFSPVSAVCTEWQKLAVSDEIWLVFYRYKFLRHNPGTMPIIPGNYLAAFRSRLASPQMGDKVEVAWRGKFRLEALDVYQGLAWWVAEVVDKHTSQGKYKIRYPGWESRFVTYHTSFRTSFLHLHSVHDSCVFHLLQFIRTKLKNHPFSFRFHLSFTGFCLFV